MRVRLHWGQLRCCLPSFRPLAQPTRKTVAMVEEMAAGMAGMAEAGAVKAARVMALVEIMQVRQPAIMA
ncbi:protein of unknown function [Pseudomonas sp. JV241A]|nr:protein of unknown function [Pseudomonas sp. JV241A]